MKKEKKIYGFGFSPDETGHHFVVVIPRATKDNVYISEHLSGDAAWKEDNIQYSMGTDNSSLRVVLPIDKWEKIAEQVAMEFNKRLRKEFKTKAASWKAGPNVLNRSFGKELVLLAWAIEDSDPNLIPTAIQNWLGLTPEERWWLYTMTNAATGHALNGRGKGWRKAVRYALTENQVSERKQTNLDDLIGLFQSPFELEEKKPDAIKKKDPESQSLEEKREDGDDVQKLHRDTISGL